MGTSIGLEGLAGGSVGKESACGAGDAGDPALILGSGRFFPWRRKWQPAAVFLPGKSHGQKSLVGYSPWGCRVRHDLATKSSWIMRWCFLQIQGVKRMRSPADVTEIIRTLKLIQVSSGFSPWTFP